MINSLLSASVAPGQKVCHPTLRCHNLSTRVSGFYKSPTSMLQLKLWLIAVKTVVDFWSNFFWIQQGLDDQDFAQVTHATETCVTTPCTASTAVTRPLPKKKSAIGTTNCKHFPNKVRPYSRQIQGCPTGSPLSNIIKHYCFSISDFNSWASLSSLYKWNSRESLKRALPARPTEQTASSLVEQKLELRES